MSKLSLWKTQSLLCYGLMMISVMVKPAEECAQKRQLDLAYGRKYYFLEWNALNRIIFNGLFNKESTKMMVNGGNNRGFHATKVLENNFEDMESKLDDREISQSQ